ncbi:MAG: hypothetical protein E7174_02340 [Firmicutes bacterium]|nr:hypothetical protein [Bacillota bacterium]
MKKFTIAAPVIITETTEFTGIGQCIVSGESELEVMKDLYYKKGLGYFKNNMSIDYEGYNSKSNKYVDLEHLIVEEMIDE